MGEVAVNFTVELYAQILVYEDNHMFFFFFVFAIPARASTFFVSCLICIFGVAELRLARSY